MEIVGVAFSTVVYIHQKYDEILFLARKKLNFFAKSMTKPFTISFGEIWQLMKGCSHAFLYHAVVPFCFGDVFVRISIVHFLSGSINGLNSLLQ
jgi:hypothetical protein